MIHPGWIAQNNSGIHFLGQDKAEVEQLSGGRATFCRNMDSYPVLMRAGEDVVLLDDQDERKSEWSQ